MKLFGIKLEVSIIFLLLLAAMAVLQHNIFAFISGICVIAHELAHLVVAKFFGYTPEKISLGIFGGVLQLKESFIRPRHELFIHLSGPCFSLIIAGICYFLFDKIENRVIEEIFLANLIIGLFNLLPFYPLDGGKITRLYMAFFWGYGRAIKISRFFSILFCIFLTLLGAFLVQYNGMCILICGLGINLLIITKKENTFFLLKTVRIMEEHDGLNTTERLVVRRSHERAYKSIEQYKPSENRTFTIVNGKGNVRGQLTEVELLEGIYDCGIYADFDRILASKSAKRAV